MVHKILIVEDDIEDQIFFIEAITSIDHSYETVAVGNGAEALQHLNHTNTLPSIILLDLNMPLMNGYEFLEKVKKHPDLNHIPVVIFTTSSHPGDKEKSTRLGAKSFFTKSSDPDKLKDTLTKILFEDSHS